MKAFKNCENFDEDPDAQDNMSKQPQAWNLVDKQQSDKTKKVGGGGKDGGKETDNSHIVTSQQLTRENHKVNDISDSQPSNDNSNGPEQKL